MTVVSNSGGKRSSDDSRNIGEGRRDKDREKNRDGEDERRSERTREKGMQAGL